jgi:AcrR family transcriptional regulator
VISAYIANRCDWCQHDLVSKIADAPSGRPYHHGDLRHALLEAALKLVSSKGAEGFSLREAAREVGVSPAAAYRHFEDRKALLSALASDGMWRLAVAMEKAVASAPGAAGSPARAAAEFLAVGQAYVEFAVRHPSHFQVMFGPWCDHQDLTEEPAEARLDGRDAFQILVDTLDGLVRSGAVPPAAREGAEIAAWASVHGLASLLVAGALPLDLKEWRQALTLIVRTQLQGMGCAPGLLGLEGKRLPAERRCRISRQPKQV